MVNIKKLYEKVWNAPNHVYNTKDYQYWFDSSGRFCRAELSDFDTTAIYGKNVIEVFEIN